MLVVPWSSPDGRLRWIDLRAGPDALDSIPEADEHPALLATLRSLNATRSPVFTAKCDVWEMSEEELAGTRDDLLLEADVAGAGLASYIDILWRDRTVFASRHHAETMLYRLDRMGTALHAPMGKLECILRPALVDLDSPIEGYAVSLYVRGVGVDSTESGQRWAEALTGVAAFFRSRELALL